MISLVAILVALGVLLIFAGLARTAGSPSRADQVVGQYARPLSLEEQELALPFSDRVMRPLLRHVAAFAMRFTPQQVMDSTRRKLDLAGNPWDLPALEFLGIRAAFVVIGAMILILLFGLLRADSLLAPVFALMGAILGFYAPMLWLDIKIRQRQEGLLLELPDALDLLAVCAEAGMGLDAGIGQIVTKGNNYISRAFARFLFELRVGKPREEALRDLAGRAEVRELTDFIAAILQAERFGTGVVQVLRIQSEQQRVMRRQRAQARVNQLPVKLLFPLTIFIFPSILIVLMGPALIRITQTFSNLGR